MVDWYPCAMAIIAVTAAIIPECDRITIASIRSINIHPAASLRVTIPSAFHQPFSPAMVVGSKALAVAVGVGLAAAGVPVGVAAAIAPTTRILTGWLAGLTIVSEKATIAINHRMIPRISSFISQ